MFERKVILGFMRVHILHHACEPDGVYGMWMIQELAQHGYTVSPGTIYPLLHEMEKEGILRSREREDGGRSRRIYRATPKGKRILKRIQRSITELHGEVMV